MWLSSSAAFFMQKSSILPVLKFSVFLCLFVFNSESRKTFFPPPQIIFSLDPPQTCRETINRLIRSVMAPFRCFLLLFFGFWRQKSHLQFKESSKRESLNVSKLCLYKDFIAFSVLEKKQKLIINSPKTRVREMRNTEYFSLIYIVTSVLFFILYTVCSTLSVYYSSVEVTSYQLMIKWTTIRFKFWPK